MMNFAPRDAPDSVLIAQLDELRRREREALPELLACVAEIERRRLHLDFAYATVFDYCVGRLRYSEGAAARRIHSARAAARFPALYVLLRDGELSLTAVSRLEPHLTTDNFEAVVARARGKRQREVEALIVELVAEKRAAEFKQEPAKKDVIQPDISLFDAPQDLSGTSAPRFDAQQDPPRRRDTIRLEAPGVVRVSFQADEKLRQDLDRLKELLKRSCPSGRLEEMLAKIIAYFLARNDPARRAAAAARSPRFRHPRKVPRWVRDRVWRRDEGRCTFIAPGGLRCAARVGLELDHIIPWSRGGSSDHIGNIRLLCKAHNLHRARRMFGAKVPVGDF